MNDKFYDCDSSLSFFIISASRLLSVFFSKHLRESGLPVTPEQWVVLAVLWDNPGLTQEELAAQLSVAKSSLSRQIELMERAGLISRSRDNTDRRRNLLHATPAAGLLKARCGEASDRAQAHLLANTDADEVGVCMKVLAQVKENVRAFPERT